MQAKKSRAHEPMGELTIKVPVRWIQFLEDYFTVAGTDRNKELMGWVKAFLLPLMEDLDAKDLISLVEKHQLTDVYKIPQWVRDEAAAIDKKA